MSPLLAMLVFAGCAASIAVAGAVLCREADVIAEATGLSRSWIGMVMLATVTSLPELVTGVSAAALAAAPDVAVGDALGSAVFNLGILGGLYVFAGRSLQAMPWRASRSMALLGAVLLAIPATLLAAGVPAAGFGFGHVGFYSAVILLGYAAAMRIAYGPGSLRPGTDTDPGPRPRLRAPLVRYGVAAVVVGASGTALPFVAVELALRMGWTQSFIGALFVAAATSLPELAVTVSAARMGAFDMAIGNLLGSNLFDVAILAIDDLAFTGGPILAHVSPLLATTAAAGVSMSALAMARPSRAVGVVLLCLYLASALLASGA